MDNESRCNVSAKPCKPGVLLPVWQPSDRLDVGNRVARASVYFLSLCYIFLGVSIIADRFMAAIEVITSKERQVRVRTITGETRIVLVRVWNETVSNLSLMALGSSTPEILLSVIEIYGNDFQAGQLGPGTIVGSAAFNLFIIIGICVHSIPDGQVRRIKHIGVFWVTVICSIFAYVWLYAITARITKDVINLWEALVTLAFFPITLVLAYLADKRIFSTLSRRYLTKPPTAFTQGRLTGHSGRVSNAAAVEMHPSVPPDGRRPSIDPTAFEHHRDRYISIFKQLRTDYPDAPIELLEELAERELMKHGPKSRAFYRIQATRRLVGGGNILSKKKLGDKTARSTRRGQSGAASEQSLAAPQSKEAVVRLSFEPGHYTCMEDVGTVYVTVACERVNVPVACEVDADYCTEDGTANAGSDYTATRGTLTFRANERSKTVGIAIVDNDLYEDDEYFSVRLTAARVRPAAGASGGGDLAELVTCRLATPAVATVLIVDNDHAGCFGFESEMFEVSESSGKIVLKVVRTRGARGSVHVPYKTLDGTAKAGRDYEQLSDSLEFVDEKISAEITVHIINDDQYEKSEDFYVELGEPCWEAPQSADSGIISSKDEVSALDGRPVLHSMHRCKIVIRESKEFKNFVDKMLSTANTSIIVGTSTWKQQFLEAATVDSSSSEDDEAEPTCAEYVMHVLTLPWKLLFALVPPTEYLGGWLCFVVSIMAIGVMTAVIGDLASHFGCTIGLKDSVTAITLVALGTSLPDTFASRSAAVGDQWADGSIGNVTGSNAVNVFLGIGIAWTIAAVVGAWRDVPFEVKSGSLAFSVTLFCVGAVVAVAALQLRRYSRSVGGELGGPRASKRLTYALFVSLWLAYVTLSTLEAYCVIPGF